MAKVCQLFSGSKGNSIFISSQGHNFLVDVGVSSKKCCEALEAIGVDPGTIEGVFVTHEHIDHSKGLRVFCTKHNVPVYASEKCIEKMYEENIITESMRVKKIDYHIETAGIEVKCFHQSHDSVDCLGFRFNLHEGRSVSVCTDTGYITQNAKEVLKGTDLIFIESNHEVSMLQAGPYPFSLKKRIMSDKGHLSNFACGEYIKELAKSGTTRFVLCHLSKENNMPEIALQTALAAFNEIGFRVNVDYRIYVSPPVNNSRGIAI
ncbi:MAG: MBL fold metallo-hydrolase [Acetobacter sp.]|nr:MBL fold metallo-hydrolase [Bacteroides sp.]MCM1341846.1 MBL fold metallo-hydrolase [Acetobacter sp.]MCM1434012.1 MBL fold metallo-hydrolase [Clostridiales bacterium]